MQINLKKQSLKSLIKSGKFDYEYINPDIYTYKPKASKVDIEYLHFGKTMTSQEVLDKVSKQGFRLATLEEALAFASTYPDEQREKDIVTIFNFKKELWYVSCGRGDGGRFVYCDRYDSVWLDVWLDYWWFAGVRKSSNPKTPSTSQILKHLDDIEIKIKEIRKICQK